MPNEPYIIEDGGDILIRYPFDEVRGSAFFAYRDLEQFSSRELNAVLQVDYYPPASKPIRLTNRINLLSASAKDDFIRSLKRLLRDDEVPIEQAFIESIEMLKTHLEKRDESLWIEESGASVHKMLLDPFLVEGSPALLFGKGGGAKTYLSLRMALSLATGKSFMGFTPTKKVKTLFVDYEDISSTFAARRGHLFMGEPELTSVENDKTIRYLRAGGIPIPDLVPRLKKIISLYDIGFIIIDSAVSACGGEPEKADIASRYFNSLAKLGIASLTIAHETKSENHAYPFGSVFWYNFPRSIWNVRSNKDDEDIKPLANTIETGLFHRKANDGPIREPIPLKIGFHSLMDGTLESVKIQRGDMTAWEDEKSISKRIKEILMANPATRADLAEAMPDIATKMIEKELGRMRKKGIIDLLGTKGSPYTLAKKSLENGGMN